MPSARMQMSGREFECTAEPHAWTHGIGVAIEIFRPNELVGVVVVLCSHDSPDFSTLSPLPPAALCDVALSRFVAGDLAVTLEKDLRWQENLREIVGDRTVSPLYCGFSPTASFPDGLIRLHGSGG